MFFVVFLLWLLYFCYITVWFGRRQVRTCVWALCCRHRQKADLENSVKFRSAKVALYMKAACLVLSFYSFWKSSEILRVSSVSVLYAAVSEVLDDLGFTYWKANLHRGRNQRDLSCLPHVDIVECSKNFVKMFPRSFLLNIGYCMPATAVPLQDWCTLRHFGINAHSPTRRGGDQVHVRFGQLL